MRPGRVTESHFVSPAKPMTTANCGATDEFDFRLIFGEDGQPGPGPPLGPAGAFLRCSFAAPGPGRGCRLPVFL